MKVVALALFFAAGSWAQAPTADSLAPDARIAPDDVLDIIVFREPELTRTSRVTPAGLISLPIVGNIKAAGLTTDRLAAEIKAVLEKSLTDPNVTVTIKEPGMQTISILGAVKVPGAYPVRGSIPLLSLLARAGSISDNADEAIQIFRSSAPSGEPPLVVRVEDLFRNGKSELNLPIHGGDTVNVLQRPAATFVMVVGEVLRAGEVPIRSPHGTTVRQALAAAGWFTRDAKKQDAKVIRINPGNGKQEEIPINLNNITEASFIDMDLTPNDIVFVPSSKSKVAITRALETAIGITSARLIYIGR